MESATSDLVDDTLINLLDSLTPAESFDLGKALSQIQKGASGALSDPTVRQIAQVALPAAGGAVGTVAGGTVGTAVGAQLGRLAASELPGAGRTGTQRPQQSATPRPRSSKPEPPAALKALLLTQNEALLRHLLAAAMGNNGRQTIDGRQTAAVLKLLASLFDQAAADADELARSTSGGHTYLTATDEVDAWVPPDRALYTSLLGAENLDLDEAWS